MRKAAEHANSAMDRAADYDQSDSDCLKRQLAIDIAVILAARLV